MQNELTKRRLSPTVTYLLTGLIFACPTLVVAGWMIPEWATNNIASATSLAIIHALVLGFMLTVAFGVLYQVVPIAFQAPPMPRHVYVWHLPLHILSVSIMIVGFASLHLNWVAIGGTSLSTGAIAYLYVLQRHYRKARNKTFVHRGLSFPLVSLLVVLLIGLWQAFWPQTISPQLVFTHALIGGVAFWCGLILVISYKFIPMFSLSHGYIASLPRAKWLFFVGIGVLIIGEWLLYSFSQSGNLGKFILVGGCLCTASGVLAFTIDILRILRTKKKKRLVNPMREALIALTIIIASQLLLLASISFGNLRIAVLSVYLLAFGGFVPLILAYMQKIVPFLWFEYRFSKRPERKTAPSLDDMVSRPLSKLAMILYMCGMGGGCVLLCFSSVTNNANIPAAIRGFPGICMAISVIILFIALRRVLIIGGPRPNDIIEPN